MKLLSILIILLHITIVHLNLIRNMAMRSKMQSLACSLYYNYNEVQKIDESIMTIAKQNNKHNNVYVPPKEYNQLLNQIKQYREIALEFLVFKMIHGDKLAAKIYMDIKNENKKISENIDEASVLDRVRKIVAVTDGIGAGYHAKYLAYEYLKNYDKKRNNRCRINFTHTSLSFIERRSKRSHMKIKTKAWESIKFYKIPLNADIRDLKHWNKEKEKFPMVIFYGETHPNDCLYENPSSKDQVDNLSEINLHPDCKLQIIGRQTDKTNDLKEIPIYIENRSHNVKFWVSQDKLEYNCIGWAVGFQDFLEIRLYTDPQQDVKDLMSFKIYLRQYREALKSIETKLQGRSRDDTEILNRIINKKKPAPSLIMSLLLDENVLEKNLVGLKDNITTEEINQICDSEMDGAVIFYGQNGELTHGARYVIELRSWTSKLGSSYLITHDLHLLDDSAFEKSLYGLPKFLYCPKSVNKEAPGVNMDRSDFS